MLPLTLDLGTRIIYTYANRKVCHGTFVGFYKDYVFIVPDEDQQIFGVPFQRSFAPCPCYMVENVDCQLDFGAYPKPKISNPILARSLLLEKRFKEKQDAKKKNQTVSIQNAKSKLQTSTTSFDLASYTRQWQEALNLTVSLRQNTESRVSNGNQLGQLNGACWPFR